MDIELESSYPTPFANSSLLTILLLSLADQKHTPNCKDTFSEEYDYIIVGAGSAGSVVASRLSELPCVKVLLLEAGKQPPMVSDVPGAARSFILTDIDWQYHTTPQRFTGNGLINQQVAWPSGKALGGSSVINAMLNVRGNRKNYDGWASLGAEGWSYEDVLPYFKKLEDNQDAEFLSNGYHGTGGPVTIMQPHYNSEVKEALISAANELGYRFVDPNGPSQRGFYDHQASMRRGQRCSTGKAYLVPAENRTNLDIVPNAMVRKVIIENEQAVGVQFDHGGSTHEVRARKEVILSAGTINTAQLLMLSGIGPRSELEKFNIYVIADLPVGQNLQDHCGTIQAYAVNERPFIEKMEDSESIMTYIDNRTGPLTSTQGCVLQAFLNNYGLEPAVDYPDHQIYFLEAATIIAKTQMGMKPEVFDQVYGPYEDTAFYWCISQILHPRSRGTVTLHSDDPYDPPLIDPNYFHNPSDLEDVVEGMKACHQVATSQPMQSVGSTPFDTMYPGCEGYQDDEDEYFRCQARSVIMTLSHQVGTAKMGSVTDPTSVVDPQLRVKGISGLRVVDASVMPTVPSGNTNIPTIMVAEKASDIIKRTVDCN